MLVCLEVGIAEPILGSACVAVTAIVLQWHWALGLVFIIDGLLEGADHALGWCRAANNKAEMNTEATEQGYLFGVPQQRCAKNEVPDCH